VEIGVGGYIKKKLVRVGRGRERNYVWMDYCTICASYLINDSN
jgi:hypothetical protein